MLFSPVYAQSIGCDFSVTSHVNKASMGTVDLDSPDIRQFVYNYCTFYNEKTGIEYYLDRRINQTVHDQFFKIYSVDFEWIEKFKSNVALIE